MATNKILRQYGKQLLFADHATDYGVSDPLAVNKLEIDTPTDVQMDVSIIADAAGWESAKTATLVDVGSAFPIIWLLGACMEGTATPTAGKTYDFHWNASPNATAANANSGGASGVDSSITVTGNALDQLIFIGSMTCRANVINKDTAIGWLTMPYIYGSLIMVNRSGVAMVADADADQCSAVLTPYIEHIQAAL